MSNNKQSHIGDTNKKVSSVEWFFSELERMQYFIGNDMLEAFKEAKAIHKEEIVEAWDNAAIDATYGNKFSSPTQYYNETFGGNNESN